MSEHFKEITVEFYLDAEQVEQIEGLVEEFKERNPEPEYQHFAMDDEIRWLVSYALRDIAREKEKAQERKKEVYTMEKWRADRVFCARPGQDVAAEIYEEMLNCIPPRTLPRSTAERSEHVIVAGFLMGEPHSTDTATGRQLYLAFGMYNGEDDQKHYCYLGLSTAGHC